MYRWNKVHVIKLIKYLNEIEDKSDDCKDTLMILKNILFNRTNLESIDSNMYYENEDYEQLKELNSLINPITNKYYKETKKKAIRIDKYKKITSTKKDILLFTRDNIKNMSPKWIKVLEPFLFSKDYIDFKHNNDNYILFLDYIGKFFISLSKNNDITDFVFPTHEYLHIYSTILNPESFNAREHEFLSILGELITTYEMKHSNLFREETFKYDYDSYTSILNYITSIIIKKHAINEEVLPQV